MIEKNHCLLVKILAHDQLAFAEDHIRNCDVVITTKGKIDEQSLYRKVVAGIAALVKRHNKKLIVIWPEKYLSNHLKLLAITKVLK